MSELRSVFAASRGSVRRFSARRVAFGLCGAILLTGTIGGMRIAIAVPESAAPAKTSAPRTEMTRERYAEYVRLFNARDDAFAQYYQENVEFDHGAVYGVLHGRQGILDFYHSFWKDIDEEIVAAKIAIDNENGVMLVELTTRLRAKKDGVRLASRMLEHKGDLFVTHDVVAYGIADGLITTIGGLALGAHYEPVSQQPEPLPNAAGPLTAALKSKLVDGYRNYLECFNQRRFACFLNFYSDDLVYDSPRWKLHGQAEFEAFYVKAWKHFTEHLTVNSIELRPNQMVVDLSNHIDVFADFPDFPARPLKKGDSFVVSGTVVYTIEHGRISRIDDD